MNVTLSALAEPNRMQIVELLRDGPLPVLAIAGSLDMRQPQVSKHLKVLSEAGIVEVQPVAQQRIYRLRAEPFKELEAWLDSYRNVWGERMDRLDNVLQTLQRKENPNDRNQ